MAKNTQRLTFIIERRNDGMLNVRLSFHPKLVSKEKFEELTIPRRQLQNAAADIGSYVLERMNQRGRNEEETKQDTVQQDIRIRDRRSDTATENFKAEHGEEDAAGSDSQAEQSQGQD